MIKPVDEPKPDYCYLCGNRVNQDDWRNHMIYHNCVLSESPKNENGEWIEEWRRDDD